MIIGLSRGDVLPALAMNPLMGLLVVIGLIGFFYDLAKLLFGLPGVRVALCEQEQDAARLAAMTLLLLNWLYLCFFL